MAPLTKILLPLALTGFATAITVPVTENRALVTKDDGGQPPFMTGLQTGQGEKHFFFHLCHQCSELACY